MHKDIDIKLTSIASPICQALIHESFSEHAGTEQKSLLSCYTDLLIIRLDNTVIGYASFEQGKDKTFGLKSIYFRSVIKNHTLGEYCISRFVERYLQSHGETSLLLAS